MILVNPTDPFSFWVCLSFFFCFVFKYILLARRFDLAEDRVHLPAPTHPVLLFRPIHPSPPHPPSVRLLHALSLNNALFEQRAREETGALARRLAFYHPLLPVMLLKLMFH